MNKQRCFAAAFFRALTYLNHSSQCAHNGGFQLVASDTDHWSFASFPVSREGDLAFAGDKESCHYNNDS